MEWQTGKVLCIEEGEVMQRSVVVVKVVVGYPFRMVVVRLERNINHGNGESTCASSLIKF